MPKIDTSKNNTGTELKILQNIEKAYYRNNDDAKRRNTTKSLKWFSQYVPRSYNKVRTSQLMRGDLGKSHLTPGRMYFFTYDALHKETLPYWDAFPMVFPWDSWTQNGHRYFIALNLHYLSPVTRFVAMKALLKLKTEKRFRKHTRLKFEWQTLKAMSQSKYFEHCVHMYRLDHVRTKFIEIPSQSWELALFLPTSRFQKGSKRQAWKL